LISVVIFILFTILRLSGQLSIYYFCVIIGLMEDKPASLRQAMVEDQLVARGIRDKKVLAAFRRVPRHEFVPAALRSAAYDDGALPIGAGQTISQPYMVAIMTELLRLKGGETVLEVGTGSGYQTAVLAELSRRVCTIEREPSLSENARAALSRLGYSNVEFAVGDGSAGCPAGAPYNGIVVTAGCPAVPQPLTDQLAEGGRLVLPLGDKFLQTLTVVTKENGRLKQESSVACVFVPLIGRYGWRG
jgi:protein-L-isoaspartate(D-aspartate) O-methyltransferase